MNDTEYKTEWMHNAALSDLQHHAEGITFNCRQIVSTPFRLFHQEPFRTKMEAELERAIIAARNAQEVLHNRLTEYRKLKQRDAA